MIELRSSDEIKSALTMWGKTAKEQDHLLHTLAVQTILHAEKHGSCALVEHMFEVLPVTFKVRLLNNWVNKYTPIVYANSKKGEGKVWRFATKDEPAYKPFDVEGANANPFYQGVKKEEPEDLTFGAILAVIKREIKKMDKAIAEGKYDGDVESALRFKNKIGDVITMGEQIKAADEAA